MSNGDRYYGGPYDPAGHRVVQGGAERDLSETSVGELVGNLSETTTRLLRQEVALAKVETREELGRAGAAIGVLSAAGAAILLALMMLSWLAVEALSRSMDQRWALLIVAGAWLLIAAALAIAGRTELRKVSLVPERTQETLREIPDVMRGHS